MEKEFSMKSSGLGPKVVTGVIGEDVHIVGIRVLEAALRKAGIEVFSLGAQVPQEEFVQKASEVGADAIFVSSFSGHAQELVKGMRERCEMAGLKGVLLYIGGYLAVVDRPWEEVEREFKQLGFDRVYPPRTSPSQVLADFFEDLKARGKSWSL
ncbi:MAG: methylaspartate mutase subunit S [candidate division WOR-3 bacterium]